MRRLNMAAASLNQTPLDWDGNAEHIRAALAAAREADVSLLCLPELAITGYGCEDAFFGGWVAERAWRELQSLRGETRGLVCSVGLPVRSRGNLYDGVALLADGELLGVVCKQYLASDGIHYEPRWFRPFPCGVRGVIGDDGVPLGDLYFEVDGVRIGFEICEDAWVAERPGRCALAREIDVLMNPSGSHFAFGKQEVRRRLVLEGSRAFGVAYLYANLLGNEAGRIIYDGGSMVAACGTLLAEAPRFSFRDFQLAIATVDVDGIRDYRAARPGMAGGQEPVEPPVRGAIRLTTVAQACTPTRPAAWESSPDAKCEEFGRAVALGLCDYVRKSRAGGCVVSLSGGADSAAVACLVWLMRELGTHELGAEGFCERLRGPACKAGSLALADILHCVYQATENSGPVTASAARTVAEAIGASFQHIDVQPMVDAYLALAPALVGRKLDWKTDDVTLQNIQARVRGPSVWLLANALGALLLTTSNRSEAAVGYATMDGDTCGGLAPVAGVDKAFLRRWIAWLERSGPAETGPLPALACIRVQPPTAELRPADARQTDEDDLMPYDVLDAIERAAIRDKHSPEECLALLEERFPEHASDAMRTWVRRFFELWSRNQWKRERYAPSFHLDDENLDPKTWCRFPILSGGFRSELEKL